MRRLLYRTLTLAAFALAAVQADATVLVLGSGWQEDAVPSKDAVTTKSAWTFTISQKSVLSIVDGFLAGDSYTLVGDFNQFTTAYAGSASDIQASGLFSKEWTKANYSKLALTLAPGAYSFSIKGLTLHGYEAGLAVRLDAVPAAVPEPASWMLMVGGFGAVGGAIRRRRRDQISRAAA